MKAGGAMVFGAGLECLDDGDRIGLKLAYLDALEAGRLAKDHPRDPYDAIGPAIVERLSGLARLGGKLKFPGWLGPRPGRRDRPRVSVASHRAFIDEGGMAEAARRCEERARAILPALPVMIAVDHALAGGTIRAASQAAGADSLAVLVLDQHLDAIAPEVRAKSAASVEVASALDFGPPGLCGDFLRELLAEGAVWPKRLFVAGVADRPPKFGDDPYGRAYHDVIRRGVRVYSRDEAGAGGFGLRLVSELLASGARHLYVSVDADVGAAAAIGAARFMDRVGLEASALREVAGAVSGLLASGRMGLSGLDLCEVETHFLGLAGPDGQPDQTVEVLVSFAAELIGAMDSARHRI